MTGGDAIGAPLTTRERAYVRRWLDRHGAAGQDSTPLLAARVAARYRAARIELATVGIVVAGILGWGVWNLATRDWAAAARGDTAGPDTAVYMAVYLAAYSAISGGHLGALRHRRRADRRIGAALPHRVARSSAVGIGQLLGGWFVVTAVVTYGGGVLIGGGGALLASHRSDRAVSAVFLAAVLVFVALGAVALVDVSRRPAIADNERSLVDDDVLRREDAHRAIAAPYLAILALIGIASSSGTLTLAFLGYMAVAAIVWGIALFIASFAAAGAAALVGTRP